MTSALTLSTNQSLFNGALSPLGDLDAYIRRINDIPMLEAQEEENLAERLIKHNDIKAAQRLILSHLRFVAKIARGLKGYGLSQADLIQEGNIGLMKAVKRFNPKLGVRLVSFAVHWIKAEMHDFIIRNWRIVKVATTKAQRKLFFNLRSAKKRLGWMNEAEIESVAEDLKVPAYEVREMEQRLNAYDEGFDLPELEDKPNTQNKAYLADTAKNPEQTCLGLLTDQTQTTALYAAMESLDERSIDIIKRRWLSEKKATLHALSDEYGISPERIRQIEAQAFAKLKCQLAKDAA